MKRSAKSTARATLSRRAFVAGTAATVGLLCAAPYISKRSRRRFTGGIVGGNSTLGHALRDGQLPPPAQTADVGIVIVGGGISGLSAARQLWRRGFKDFVVLELENRPGGNAISGRNEVSAFPWAAHYVPIASSDTVEVTKLFEELGVIRGHDDAGRPIYHEEYLCADPMERLFTHGRWQEGIVPQVGLSAAEQEVQDSFFAEMRRLKDARGKDGRRAFAIPLDASSQDEEFRRLDKITMADYLRENGWFDAATLRWYVDYCCRDDYGAGIDKVSAWAGVHYFASRNAVAANAAGDAVVTWPEGNGWFVEQLQAPFASHIHNSCAVWNIEPEGPRVLVDYYDAANKQSYRLRAQGVVWAGPQFVAQRVIRPLREQRANPGVVYSPWMVANLTLDALPAGRGMDLAWDNVIYDSPSLGYVVATHQNLQTVPRRTVLTYYQPLDEDEPAVARQKAWSRSYHEWCEMILSDLAKAHPDIGDRVTNLDVWLWGHAMARPVPGFIWGAARAEMRQPCGNVVFAHSDLSGLSIFEEAYTHGVRAADALLHTLSPT
ncbi:MAG TPA: FAD-dependent oxidoreductase [Verrucomicrobiae bacterium]|nr:FAD-dependent oxidoreductase [Verrucomicrobiae bacterium]